MAGCMSRCSAGQAWPTGRHPTRHTSLASHRPFHSSTRAVKCWQQTWIQTLQVMGPLVSSQRTPVLPLGPRPNATQHKHRVSVHESVPSSSCKCTLLPHSPQPPAAPSPLSGFSPQKQHLSLRLYRCAKPTLAPPMRPREREGKGVRRDATLTPKLSAFPGSVQFPQIGAGRATGWSDNTTSCAQAVKSDVHHGGAWSGPPVGLVSPVASLTACAVRRLALPGRTHGAR